MNFSESDVTAILLTLKLAATVTILLIIFGTPLSWWLARTKSKFKAPIEAIVTLPLILPPTVIGFYFLVAMGPNGFIGDLTEFLGIGTLPFTFLGLVVASMIYSLPFVIQPLQNAFAAIDQRTFDIATSLGASPLDRFFTVALPNAKRGFLSASVLGFTHTIGEFGLVLMIGGNIPGETQLISIQMYEHVESLQYGQAHALALTLVVFSFIALVTLYLLQSMNKSPRLR